MDLNQDDCVLHMYVISFLESDSDRWSVYRSLGNGLHEVEDHIFVSAAYFFESYHNPANIEGLRLKGIRNLITKMINELYDAEYSKYIEVLFNSPTISIVKFGLNKNHIEMAIKGRFIRHVDVKDYRAIIINKTKSSYGFRFTNKFNKCISCGSEKIIRCIEKETSHMCSRCLGFTEAFNEERCYDLIKSTYSMDSIIINELKSMLR